jgi:hypothetical protein
VKNTRGKCVRPIKRAEIPAAPGAAASIGEQLSASKWVPSSYRQIVATQQKEQIGATQLREQKSGGGRWAGSDE